jgi:hypothetical protein
LHYLNPPHTAVEKLNTGFKDYTTKSKALRLLYMENLKLLGTKEEEEEQQQQMQIERSVMISICNLDLTVVQR